MKELEVIEAIERIQQPSVRKTCEYKIPYEGDLKQCTCPRQVQVFCPSHVDFGDSHYCAFDLLAKRGERFT
jgi:hypothetical protein